VIEEKFVDIDGRRTRYLTAGSGPAVILLHAAGESAADWQWIIPALARTHRIYALDLYPVDGSCRAASYSLDFFSSFVDTFLTALDIDRAIVIGNSLGGLIALGFNFASPSRVTALGLIDSAGLGRDVHPALVAAVAPGFGDVAAAWCKTPLGALQRVWAKIPLLFASVARIPWEWHREQYRLAQLPCFSEAALASLRAQIDFRGQRTVVVGHLHQVHVPVLLVWGENDQIFPLRHAEVASRVCNARLAVIPQCGHLPEVEQPRLTAEAIASFLRETNA
jgi:pimeloyl-ACP methyl ester carboxylesterase